MTNSPGAGGPVLARRALDRTVRIAPVVTSHAVMNAGDPWRERTGESSAPAPGIDGPGDPVLLYGHRVALARQIPGAHLLPPEQAGHELPRAVWDVVPAILRHTSGGR